MRKLKLVVITTVCSLYLNAQQGGSPGAVAGSGWTSKDRADFIGECIKAASEGMSRDSAKFYCFCMQDKMEDKYPNIEDAGKVTPEELTKPEWQTLIRSCINAFWAADERATFVKECVDAAKVNLPEDRAISYCDCMLFKVQVQYPDYKMTSDLTQEKLNSPEWKKIIKRCIDF